MRNDPKRKQNRSSPALRVRQLLWVALAPATLIALVLIFGSALSVLNVPWPRSYVGSLRPANELVPVYLPARIPIKTILVQAGEDVQPGQTLVVLDKAEIETQLADVTQALKLAEIQRQCIFNLQANNTVVAPVEDVHSDLVAPFDFEQRTADRECKLEQSEARQSRAVLVQQQSLLKDRLGLVERRLALAIAQTSLTQDPPSDRAGYAADALSIAHSRNLLQSELADLHTRLKNLTLKVERKNLDRSRAITAQIQTLIDLKSLLDKYAVEPRLHAPSGGRILRVRSTGMAHAFQAKVVLIEIEQSGSTEFVADLHVPVQDAKTLKPGQAVRITALGMAADHPSLRGVIQSFSAPTRGTQTGRVLVKARLTDASTLILQNVSKGVALHGRDTASIIDVDIASRDLGAVLTQTGKAAFHRSTRFSRFAEYAVSALSGRAMSPPTAERPAPQR